MSTFSRLTILLMNFDYLEKDLFELELHPKVSPGNFGVFLLSVES